MNTSERARRLLAFWDMLTPHARWLYADAIRDELYSRGFSPKAVLTVPHAALAAIRKMIEDEEAPCLDE